MEASVGSPRFHPSKFSNTAQRACISCIFLYSSSHITPQPSHTGHTEMKSVPDMLRVTYPIARIKNHAKRLSPCDQHVETRLQLRYFCHRFESFGTNHRTLAAGTKHFFRRTCKIAQQVSKPRESCWNPCKHCHNSATRSARSPHSRRIPHQQEFHHDV